MCTPRSPSAALHGPPCRTAASQPRRLGELLVFSPSARANRCFCPAGAVGPGTWPVYGRPTEPPRLSVGARANCWFSALSPGERLFPPRGRRRPGTWPVFHADRLAEPLVLSPSARANRYFRPPGAVGPGDLACPRTPCRTAATPGRTTGFQPCRLGELLFLPRSISITCRKAVFPGTWPAHGPRG
jgi:hypothetical protein